MKNDKNEGLVIFVTKGTIHDIDKIYRSELVTLGKGLILILLESSDPEHLVKAYRKLETEINIAQSERKKIYLLGENYGSLVALVGLVKHPKLIQSCVVMFNEENGQKYELKTRTQVKEILQKILYSNQETKNKMRNELQSFERIFSLSPFLKLRFRSVRQKVQVFLGAEGGDPLKISSLLLEKTSTVSVCHTVSAIGMYNKPELRAWGHRYIARLAFSTTKDGAKSKI